MFADAIYLCAQEFARLCDTCVDVSSWLDPVPSSVVRRLSSPLLASQPIPTRATPLRAAQSSTARGRDARAANIPALRIR